MEPVIFKWILDTFGPIGVLLAAGTIVYLYMSYDRSTVKQKEASLDMTKDLLLHQYKEAAEVERANVQARALMWAELKAIIEERIPRRARS